MNKYEKAITDLDTESHNKGPEQITIDIIQDVVQELITDADEEDVTRDKIGSWIYQISILLEVMDPKFELDISLLNRLNDILEEWSNDIEFVHKALGGTY